MQRIFNLDKWTVIPDGKALDFNTDRPRVVRLDVNCAGTANLYVVQKDEGEAAFLARIVGRDVIEFHSAGGFSIVCDGDPVSVYSVDGETWTFHDPAPVIFTRIHERRARNPDLELVMARMAQNMERRLAVQADELARLFERREAARAAASGDSVAGGAAGAQSAAPEGAGGKGDDPPPKRSGKRAERDDEV